MSSYLEQAPFQFILYLFRRCLYVMPQALGFGPFSFTHVRPYVPHLTTFLVLELCPLILQRQFSCFCSITWVLFTQIIWNSFHNVFGNTGVNIEFGYYSFWHFRDMHLNIWLPCSRFEHNVIFAMTYIIWLVNLVNILLWVQCYAPIYFSWKSGIRILWIHSSIFRASRR